MNFTPNLLARIWSALALISSGDFRQSHNIKHHLTGISNFSFQNQSQSFLLTRISKSVFCPAPLTSVNANSIFPVAQGKNLTMSSLTPLLLLCPTPTHQQILLTPSSKHVHNPTTSHHLQYYHPVPSHSHLLPR